MATVHKQQMHPSLVVRPWSMSPKQNPDSVIGFRY